MAYKLNSTEGDEALNNPKNKSNRGIFSISKEFQIIHEILEKTPNASRFICEAIIEKHNNKNEPVKTITSLSSDDVLVKISDSLDKCCDSLDGLIELKVKDVIQKIIANNQVNSVLSGTFTGVRNFVPDIKESDNNKYENKEPLEPEEESAKYREEKLNRFKNW